MPVADPAQMILRLAPHSNGTTEVRVEIRAAWFSGEARAVTSGSELHAFSAALLELARSGNGSAGISLSPPLNVDREAVVSLRVAAHGSDGTFFVKVAMPADRVLREALGVGQFIMTPSLFCDAQALERFAGAVAGMEAGVELAAVLIGEPGI